MVVPKLRDVNEVSSEMLATARCIIAASTDGEIDFTVPGIAERTGLTVEAVRSVLASPTYQDLMAQEVRTLVTHTVVRGVRALDAIITDDKAKNSDKIAAHRAVVATAVAMQEKGNEPQAPDSDFNKLLETLQKKRLSVENVDASTRRTPPGPSPEREEGE